MLRDEYVREDAHVESEGVLTVKVIDYQGYREILSVFVAPAEEEATWSAVFSDLVDRGLDPREVYSVVSDEHKGLKKALRRYFPKVIWQRCQTHSPEGHAYGDQSPLKRYPLSSLGERNAETPDRHACIPPAGIVKRHP
ncbi:MAG: transposase [Anaerolineales bacterium]|jgi:hypothetical protein